MFKWAIIFAVAGIVTLLAIRIIKVMIKSEKDSKKSDKPATEEKAEEYVPQSTSSNVSASDSAMPMADFNNEPKKDSSQDNYFTDHADDEFFDYSNHMHSRGRRRKPKFDDIDLDGDMADDGFEYMPSTPEFGYLQDRELKRKKPLKKELNELPTELKVLMLSDIFDRKFFD